MIDAELRSLLVCPVCRGELVDVPRGLTCQTDALTFLVVDDVPHLVRELAQQASIDELQRSAASAKA